MSGCFTQEEQITEYRALQAFELQLVRSCFVCVLKTGIGQIPRSTIVGWHDLPQPHRDHIIIAAYGLSGADFQAWVHLSLVCREWRELLEHAPLNITFSAPVTPARTTWLRSTRLRSVQHISFPKEVTGDPPRHDPACSLLATDACALAHSAASLAAAMNIVIPSGEPTSGSPDPLRRFMALTDVTLLMDGGIDERRLARLPPSVRRLWVMGAKELSEHDNSVTLEGDLTSALPSLEKLLVAAPAHVRCQLSSLPSGLRQLRLTGLSVSLTGGHCALAPDLVVVTQSIMAILHVSSDARSPSHAARLRGARLRGARLEMSARKLRLTSSWQDRHAGEQPSAAAVLLDNVVRQPFAELALWQHREEQALELECVENDDGDQVICSETFGSLRQLHDVCRGLATQAGVSCELSVNSGGDTPAFILTLSDNGQG